MKIEIDLLEEPTSYEIQIKAVLQYIKENTIKTENYGCFGDIVKVQDVVFFSKIEIKPSKKGLYSLIEIKDVWRKFYIYCNKTQKGTYKFKVKNAQ